MFVIDDVSQRVDLTSTDVRYTVLVRHLETQEAVELNIDPDSFDRMLQLAVRTRSDNRPQPAAPPQAATPPTYNADFGEAEQPSDTPRALEERLGFGSAVPLPETPEELLRSVGMYDDQQQLTPQRVVPQW